MIVFTDTGIEEAEIRHALEMEKWDVVAATLQLQNLAQQKKAGEGAGVPAAKPLVQQKPPPRQQQAKANPLANREQAPQQARNIGQQFEMKMKKMQEKEEESRQTEIKKLTNTKKAIAQNLQGIIFGTPGAGPPAGAYVAPPRRPLNLAVQPPVPNKGEINFFTLF